MVAGPFGVPPCTGLPRVTSCAAVPNVVGVELRHPEVEISRYNVDDVSHFKKVEREAPYPYEVLLET
jgi:hypothetical protein